MKPNSRYSKTWKKKNPEANQRHKKAHNERSQKNAVNAKSRWSREEEDLICAPNRPPDAVLSVTLGRSRAAILQKRAKLKAEGRRVHGGPGMGPTP